MSEAKQSRIEFETWEYILPAIEEIAKVSAKGLKFDWFTAPAALPVTSCMTGAAAN